MDQDRTLKHSRVNNDDSSKIDDQEQRSLQYLGYHKNVLIVLS